MDVGSAVLSSVWVLTGLSCLFAIARIVMKILRVHGVALEDYLMFLSVAFAVMYGSYTVSMYRSDISELAALDRPEFARDVYIGHALGFLAPLFGRISFCVYMLGIVGPVFVSRKRTIQLFVALQVAVNVPITILVFTQCGSFPALWKHGLQRDAASCIPIDTIKVLALITVTFNAITDLYLTILPAVVVWNIKAMTTRARLGLFAVLGFSFFATIASTIKIYCVYALYAYTTTIHVIARLIVVMAVEMNVVIIAASIPILAPIFLGNLKRKSMLNDPVLPTYEARVEGTPKSGLLRLTNLSRRLPTEYPSIIRYDSGSEMRSWTTDVDEDPTKRARTQSLEILKTVLVAINMSEQKQVSMREHEIVPESLRRSVSRDNSNIASSLETWEELPTPLFLSEGDGPSFESK
ncbi:hypothetical protein D6D05_07132 [Aureobasidium pullulans]|nr:hypothetical protein D6D05_07132 [Aureobasidium pullulans]